MDEILTDLSPAAQVRAIKGNLLALFRFLGRAPQTEFSVDSGLVRWRTRVGHPWFNGVISARPAGPDESGCIQAAIDYFRAGGAPVFTWWLDPPVEGTGWEAQLAAQGLHHAGDTPGMALDLADLPETLPLPPGVTVRPVRDPAAMREWTRVFVEGYGIPPELEAPFFDLLAGAGLDLPARYYTGSLDGRPVATSQLFLAAGAAGILCVATLPEARGRGLGAALTLAPLYEARDRGYRLGILQSSEMGYNLYRRLGFQERCRMDHYVYFDRV